MAEYRIFYVGIGGIERCATVEAEDVFEAREEFERTHWAWHEILSVEPVRK